MSIHKSNCHIVGNNMSRLMCFWFSETVNLSTHNRCFSWEIRKLIISYTLLTEGLSVWVEKRLGWCAASSELWLLANATRTHISSPCSFVVLLFCTSSSSEISKSCWSSDTMAVSQPIKIQRLFHSEQPRPIQWNQTSDVHRGSTLMMWRWRHRSYANTLTNTCDCSETNGYWIPQ